MEFAGMGAAHACTGGWWCCLFAIISFNSGLVPQARVAAVHIISRQIATPTVLVSFMLVLPLDKTAASQHSMLDNPCTPYSIMSRQHEYV